MLASGDGSRQWVTEAIVTKGVLSPQDHRFLDELVKLDNVELAVDILMSRGASCATYGDPEEPRGVSARSCHSCASVYPRFETTCTDDQDMMAPPIEPYAGKFQSQFVCWPRFPHLSPSAACIPWLRVDSLQHSCLPGLQGSMT